MIKLETLDNQDHLDYLPILTPVTHAKFERKKYMEISKQTLAKWNMKPGKIKFEPDKDISAHTKLPLTAASCDGAGELAEKSENSQKRTEDSDMEFVRDGWILISV